MCIIESNPFANDDSTEEPFTEELVLSKIDDSSMLVMQWKPLNEENMSILVNVLPKAEVSE